MEFFKRIKNHINYYSNIGKARETGQYLDATLKELGAVNGSSSKKSLGIYSNTIPVNDRDISLLKVDFFLAYYFYVQSDLIRTAIEVISNEVQRQRFVAIDISQPLSKQRSSRQAKAAQKWLDDIDGQHVIRQQIAWFGIFNNGAIHIERNPLGQAIGLTNLSWLGVTPERELSTGRIKHFKYQNSGGAVDLPVNDVIHVLPDASDCADPLTGIPKSVSCVGSLRNSDILDIYTFYLLSTGNNQGLLLNFNTGDNAYEDEDTEICIDKVRTQLSSIVGAVQPIIGKNVDVQTNSTSRDTPFDALHNITAKKVARTYLMPDRVLNIAESGQLGSNTSIDDQRRLSEAMLTYMMPVCDAISRDIFQREPGWSNIRIIPEKHVPPVNLDHGKVVSMHWRDDIITFEEIRASIGLPVDENDERRGCYYSDIIRMGRKLDIEEGIMPAPDMVNQNQANAEEQRQERDS